MEGPTGTGTGERVLLVAADDRLRESLQVLLVRKGFDLAVARSVPEARRRLECDSFHGLVLDADTAPRLTIELVRSLSGDGRRVLFVVGPPGDEERAELAFACGADDFSARPPGPELAARLHAAVNRRSGGESTRLQLHRNERTCHLDGRLHHLTRHERDFLACLLDAPGHFARYDELITAVWGDGAAVETQYLRVLAAQVRRKLKAEEGSPPLIHTVTGEGLKLNP